MRRWKQRGLAVLEWGSEEDSLGTNKIKAKDKYVSNDVLNAQMWLLVYQNRLVLLSVPLGTLQKKMKLYL